MTASQNGYEANDRSLIRSATIAGTDVRVAVREGPAGDLLLYAAARWNREVEPLRAPDGVLDCWGYAERLIRGSATVVSNHASGTALDLRARAHPLGKAGTYSAAQVAAIRRLVADCRGAIRWGGSYSGRVDEMHIEVTATEAGCRRVLAQLTAIDHSASPAAAGPAPTQSTPTQHTPTAEEDDVHIPLTVDEHGGFHTTVMAEVGDGTATGYGTGWVTVGTAWGGTDFVVTALGADGPIGQFNAGYDSTGRPVPLHLPNNTQLARQLPDGTRMVTVEGFVNDKTAGTVPAAAIWHVR